MIKILTRHDIDEVLQNPQREVYGKEDLVSINGTVISLAEDNSRSSGYCFEVRYPTGFITTYDTSFGYDALVDKIASEPDVSTMSYSDFCVALEEEDLDRFRAVLVEDEFYVFKDEHTGRYYFFERNDVNDASDFFEVYPVSSLTYDVNHDIKVKDGAKLASLFDCVCCGEEVSDETIKYWWFEMKRPKFSFFIETVNDNGSGMKYDTKKALFNELSLMIDDCIANGGTFIDFQVDSDASCFACEEDEYEEDDE